MKHFKVTFLGCLLLVAAVSACKERSNETNTPNEDDRTQVVIETTHGNIRLALYNQTPLHRDNFINLVRNKAYDSLLFHRVIDQFMIQAGDPDSKMASPTDTLGDGDAPYLVQAEFNDSLFHKKGVLAAARDNNPERASSAMQFYIVQGVVFNDSLLDLTEIRINKGVAERYVKEKGMHPVLTDSMDQAMDAGNYPAYLQIRDSLWSLVKDDSAITWYRIPSYQRDIYKTLGGTPHLDQNYTVFGEVMEGLEVVDSIAATETNNLDRPLQDVRIISARIVD